MLRMKWKTNKKLVVWLCRISGKKRACAWRPRTHAQLIGLTEWLRHSSARSRRKIFLLECLILVPLFVIWIFLFFCSSHFQYSLRRFNGRRNAAHKYSATHISGLFSTMNRDRYDRVVLWVIKTPAAFSFVRCLSVGSSILNKHYELIKYNKDDGKCCGWKKKWVDGNNTFAQVLCCSGIMPVTIRYMNAPIGNEYQRLRWHIFPVWFLFELFFFSPDFTYKILSSHLRTHTHKHAIAKIVWKTPKHFISYCVILSCECFFSSSSCTSFFFISAAIVVVVFEYMLFVASACLWRKKSTQTLTRSLRSIEEILCHLQEISIKIKFEKKNCWRTQKKRIQE